MSETKSTIIARIKFEELIRAESQLDWSDKTRLANLLMRHGKTYAKIQEMMCNGVDTYYGESNESFRKRQDRHEKWTEKRDSQLEKRIREIVTQLGPGFDVVFQGDPRGCTVKIVVPSGKTTDMGGEGVCVPTA